MKKFEEMNKQELAHQLDLEMHFYVEGHIDKELSKILVTELPKEYVYRIISKMYRKRTQ